MASIRVLIVDDFEMWRSFVSTFLQNRPNIHVAGFASDGLEAIQKAEELQPDVILLDISLPKLGGIEAAREIRKRAPKSRIVFLSCHADPQIVRAALCAGGQGYILKWEAAQSLWAGIEEILKDNRFLSESLVKIVDSVDTAT